MSGRLIILPKKSYCPWNPENVERVLKDEREHAEEQERKQKEQQQDLSRERMVALKGKSQAAEEDKPLQHVNLFEDEEKKCLEQHQKEEKKKKKGIMPLYLGQSVNNDPFYLRDRSEEKKGVTAKEERLKNRLDPMNEFQVSNNPNNRARAESSTVRGSRLDETVDNSTTSNEKRKKGHRYSSQDSSSDDSVSDSSIERRDRRRRKKRKKSHKRHRREEKSKGGNSSKNTTSILELRQRRLEREERERERLKSRSSKYSDQYNPHLSRR